MVPNQNAAPRAIITKHDPISARATIDEPWFWGTASARDTSNRNDWHDRSDRLLRQRLDHRLEDHEAIGAAEHRLAGAFRMRHQANDIAGLIAETGNSRRGAIRVGLIADLAGLGAVAENDLAVRVEPGNHLGLSEVIAFAVSDWKRQHLTTPARHREWCVGLFNPHVDLLTLKLQAPVPQHGARQQSSFKQHLEAVADAEHRSAAIGERLHLAHDRRKTRHRSASQVVPVREATRKNDDICALEIRVLMPEIVGGLTEHVLGGVICVVVAVAS